MNSATPCEGWTAVAQPPGIFRRFEFPSYAQTRRFLDALAQMSAETGLYPDLSFGPRHVVVTLRAADGGPVGAVETAYAGRAAACAAEAV